MIHDVDEALRALLERDALAGSGVEVSLEAPSKAWAARQTAPVVDVYLLQIREDVERRAVQYEEVRGDRGVVDRRMPPRMFSLTYLVTAWTQRPEDEHRLLGALLGALLRHPALPRDLLGGALAEHPAPLRMVVGLPGDDRTSSDVWNALGGDPKPSLEVVVTAPVDPNRRQEVGPLVTEGPVLRAHAPGAAEVRRLHRPADTPRQ
ncbi:MAG: DUF4255 domain-containing protein [Actinomycetota bacterium]|nr:DUF4255 domain-containing protein [Actinomycetota bacterium]